MKKADRTKFFGTYRELQDRITYSGIDGVWEDRDNHKLFRAENGATLNWWMSTNTLQIQGRSEAEQELRRAYEKGIAVSKAKIEYVKKYHRPWAYYHKKPSLESKLREI